MLTKVGLRLQSLYTRCATIGVSLCPRFLLVIFRIGDVKSGLSCLEPIDCSSKNFSAAILKYFESCGGKAKPSSPPLHPKAGEIYIYYFDDDRNDNLYLT